MDTRKRVRSASIKKSNNLAPQAKDLNAMSMKDLQQLAKKIIPEFQNRPIKGWNLLSAQQKKQVTKLRKDAIVYSIDSKINQPRSKDTPAVGNFTVKQDKMSSGAIKTTLHYKKPIRRSDYSYEELIGQLIRISRMSNRPGIQIVQVGVQFQNGYRLMKISDLIALEIRYDESIWSFAQDYTIQKIVTISVAPMQAACDSEEHTITVCVNYDSQVTLKIKAKSYKSQNQNCLIAIFKHASKSQIGYAMIRKQLSIAPKDAIALTELPKIADMFNCGYIIYNNQQDSLEVIEQYQTDRQILVEALIVKGHAYHIINIPNELRSQALRGVQLIKPDVSTHQLHGYKQIINDPELQQIQSLVDSQENILIHGAGGVGKSYISKALKNVILCATTGIASLNIGGKTIDHVMCCYKTKTQFTKAFPNKSHILIDEASMIGASKINKIWEFCHTVGVHLVLVGDMCQLPPVQDEFFFSTVVWKEMIQPSFTLINLTIIKRQDKADQQVFLNNMRVGKFDFGYYKRLRAQPPIQNPDLIIVSTNELRKQYNKKAFDNLQGEIITMEHVKDIKLNSKPIILQSQPEVIKAIKRECYQYDSEEFKIGCRIMVTENIDVSNGIVNGTRGYITQFNQNQIQIRTDTGQSAQISYIEKHIEVSKGVNASFMELPIVVAYAITCHKAQGQTVTSAMIDTTGLFEQGQLYVALSRVRDLNNLQLVGRSDQPYIEKWANSNQDALDFCDGKDVIGKEERHLIDYSLKQLSGVRRKKIVAWELNNMIFFDFETRNVFSHNFVKQEPYYNRIKHCHGNKEIKSIKLFDQLWEGGERCNVARETYAYVKGEMLRYADMIKSLVEKRGGKDTLDKKTYNKYKDSVPTIIAYNGSGFDLHFLVSQLLNDQSLKKRFHISTIYKGSQLVSFVITDKNTNKVVLKSHDMCQILNLPLKKALEQFCKKNESVKQLVEKIEFREEIIQILNEYTNNPSILKPGVMTPIFKYITTSDGVQKIPVMNKDGTQKTIDLYEQVIRYADNDTEVLLPLYESINSLCEKYFKASVFQFLTAGSMAWYGFLINLPAEALKEGTLRDKNGHEHKIINTKLYRPEMNEYDFIKQSMYGGRVAPRIHQIKQEEVREDSEREGRDCRPVYLDISGMYVSIMRTKAFPYGRSSWMSREETQSLDKFIKGLKQQKSWAHVYDHILRKGNMFIAEVDFCENQYNPEPVVPFKDAEHGRTYFINDRRTQVITSIDIALIIQSGGTIFNINKVLQWETYGDIMSKWMAKTLEIKEEGARNGDDGIKAFGKLLGNSTYGQTLKGDKREKIQFIDNIEQAIDFCDKFELTNFIDYENFDAYIGKMKVSKFDFISSRCQAIGVFVLAYTRTMIFDICEVAMPNRYNEQGVYEQPYNGDTDSLVFRRWQADLLIQAGWIGLENGKLTDELGEESVWFNPPSAQQIIQEEKSTGKDFRYGKVNELIYANASEEEKRNPSYFYFTYVNNAIFPAPKSYAVDYHNNVKNKNCDKIRFKGISKDSTIKVGDSYQNISYGLVEKAYSLRNESDDQKLCAVLPNKPQMLKRPTRAEGYQNMFSITNCNQRRHVDKNDPNSQFKAVSRVLFKTQWKGRHHYTENITLPYGHPLSKSFAQYKEECKTSK